MRGPYEPNGNMTFKSDVGVLSYKDPAHPHAVTSVGSGSSGDDAVGNQITRPGGVLVTYTPFDEIKAGAGSQLARYLNHEGPPPREEPPSGPKEKEDARQAGEVGAAAPPADVDTTGSSPEHDPQAATTAPDDWRQNPYVQIEGGFLAGVSLGLVPLGGVGQQLADAGEVLPHGTPEARLGLAVGQVVGGIALTVGGFTGEVLGGAATVTGIGAAVGVTAMVVSTTLVVGGAGNIAAGVRGLTQAMMSKGSGRTTPKGEPKELPRRDSTGKVHGELPKASELRNYSVEGLRQLQAELRQSVEQRIRVNSAMGPKGNHGLRQAQEQELIRQIEKHLEDR